MHPETKVVLYVRTNIHWAEMNEKRFLEQSEGKRSSCLSDRKSCKNFLRRIKLWDSVFDIPYFEYRRRLQVIARANWDRIAEINAIVIDDRFIDQLAEMDNTFVLPVDDDDWFHPKVARVVASKFKDTSDVLAWSYRKYMPQQQSGKCLEDISGNCFGTNGYCIPGSTLRYIDPDKRRQILLRHLSAKRFFTSNGYECQRLTHFLSMKHESPASITALRNIDTKAGMLKLKARLPGDLPEIPEGAGWAKQCLKEAYQLNQELTGNTTVKTIRFRSYRLNHTKILNAIADRMNVSSYLEIGLGGGGNFKAVTASRKVGVDPRPCKQPSTLKITSDQFFESNQQKFDLVFIDGLHHCDQVIRDIENSLRMLNPGGTIVCHDMNPAREIDQMVPRKQMRWNGDCWKAWMHFRKARKDLEMVVIDCDHGCGIIRKGRQTVTDTPNGLSWKEFDVNRVQWLNLVPIKAFWKLLDLWSK